MKKSYKVKVNQTADKSEVVNVSADKAQATKIPAVAGARYQLIDNNTGLAPDNIRAKRIGKDLGVIFEGRSEPDLLITDYYENTATGFNALIGEAESGAFHAYIPESANGATSIGVMADGSAQVGMALGGEQIAASGAAVGTLVAAAGFSPLWALPLALLGAGGGGGGAAAAVVTGPKVSASKLHQEDDTGVSNTDNITADNTPRIVVDADAGATVTVKINGKEYAGKEVSPGRYEIPVTDALPDGLRTFDVVAKNASGGTTTFAGTPFVVDTSGSNNQPDGTTDPNATATVDITAITTDSGINPNDFITSDKTLTYSGTVRGFTANGDKVKVELLAANGTTVLETAYVDVTGASSTTAGPGAWSWTRSAEHADGQYTVRATIVDQAGNRVNTTAPSNGTGGGFDEQQVVVNTSNANVTAAKLHQADDTGVSNTDNITADNTPRIVVDADAGATVTVKINGKEYAGKEVSPGRYEIPVTDALPDGLRTFDVVAKNASGGTTTFAGTPFVVDTSSANNYVDPDKTKPTEDPNNGITVTIESITTDTGSSKSDFYTSDNTLDFKGTVGSFTNNGDMVELFLRDASGKVLASEYVLPDSGQWTWKLTTSMPTLVLADGKYTITARVVDKAGNAVSPSPIKSQDVYVDTKGSTNQPDNSTDPNTAATITISSIDDGISTLTATTGSKDTGASASDFVTSDNDLCFYGTTNGFNGSAGAQVLVQILNAGNAVVAEKYVTPDDQGKWKFDNQANDKLKDGSYTISASIVDKAGNPVKTDTHAMVIKTSVDPSNPNKTATIDIDSISVDSGVSRSDFITNDSTLTYSGKVAGFTANGDKVKVELLSADGTTVIATAYVTVTVTATTGGAGTWTWAYETKQAEGQYTVRATIVDAADNRVNSAVGGQDTQIVIVDTSGGTVQPSGQPDPNTNATVDIVAITEDRGVSATDFITNDKSLTYRGTVSQFTANGDKVKLELLAADGTTVLETAYVDVTGANSTTAGAGSWSWTRPTEHADGQYSLRATLVDTAGNRVNTTDPTNGTGGGQDTQILKINTGSGVDPKNLEIGITSFGKDQDSGNSNTDFLTNVQKLSFKGSFSSGGAVFNAGAKILVQVIDTSGKILSMSYQDLNSNGSWVFNNESNILGVDGENTQYLLKASIVDLAGNILKTTDQSFVVDLKKPSFTPKGNSAINTDSGDVTYTTMSIEAGTGDYHSNAENGKFYFTDKNNVKIDGPKAGVISSYNAGDFVIHFIDLAGNESLFSNPSKWIFNLQKDIEFSKPDYVSPSTFNQNELAGSIGKYVLSVAEPVYDLASLHTDAPQIDDWVVHNHIGLSGSGTSGFPGYIQNANHTLNLTTSDVLALGVENSFVSDGRLQLRIDGDAGDKVNLDNLFGETSYKWVHTNDVATGFGTYDKYINDALNLEVFIQSSINQQLLHIA